MAMWGIFCRLNTGRIMETKRLGSLVVVAETEFGVQRVCWEQEPIFVTEEEKTKLAEKIVAIPASLGQPSGAFWNKYCLSECPDQLSVPISLSHWTSANAALRS